MSKLKRIFPVIVILPFILLLSGCLYTTYIVNSDPPGAKIYVDDSYIGTTPHTFYLEDPVDSTMVVTREGYKEVYKHLTSSFDVPQYNFTLEKEKGLTQGLVPVAAMEVNLDLYPDGQVEIVDLVRGGPAYVAGIRRGDIIIALDDYLFTKTYEIRKYIFLVKKPGESVLVTIKRNNKNVDFNVKLGGTYILEEHYFILKCLAKKEKVRLVVIPGEIANVTLQDPLRLEQWREGIKIQLLGEWENSFLKWFGVDENFSLVDRQRVEAILKEQKFSSSEMVSEESRNKLGRILGVTHLLIINFSRFDNADIKTRRLIEIDTGRVISSVKTESPN